MCRTWSLVWVLTQSQMWRSSIKSTLVCLHSPWNLTLFILFEPRNYDLVCDVLLQPYRTHLDLEGITQLLCWRPSHDSSYAVFNKNVGKKMCFLLDHQSISNIFMYGYQLKAFMCLWLSTKSFLVFVVILSAWISIYCL